jgi:hypothetical protein
MMASRGPDIARNLEKVRERIARAAARAGRSAESVTLVAVTKGVPPDLVREAVEAGVTDIGENRVQEGAAKRSALDPTCPGLVWHFIGHLQANKAARASRLFDLIHSVDRRRVAEALSRAWTRDGRPEPLKVLVQVNASGEETKFGVRPEAATDLVRVVCRLPGLRVMGLMTMAPLTPDPEETRPVFRRVRRLAMEIDRLGLSGVSMEYLSMGMSQDYEVAVSEGANVVRIGTAIFGPREG